jgi:hypothetical protein
MFNINTREDFVNIFTALNYNLGAELGTYQGSFAKHILDSWNGKLICIDLFDRKDNTNLFQEKGFFKLHIQDKSTLIPLFNNNIYPHKDRILTVQSNTSSAAKFFPDNHFDFIYIDADHSYESVLSEMINWYPKLKSKGLFSGHDFLPNFDYSLKNNEIFQPHDKSEYVGTFGVNTAVTEFTNQYNIKFYTTNEPYWKSWYWFKP